MEKRETYYELYANGDLVTEGSYEQCFEESLHCLDDDCTEIYKVTVYEEKVH